MFRTTVARSAVVLAAALGAVPATGLAGVASAATPDVAPVGATAVTASVLSPTTTYTKKVKTALGAGQGPTTQW